MEVGHWLCNEDSLLQAWVGIYGKTWTSDIWLLLIFCEERVPWTIFSQLERLMRSSHTRQPGVAEDIERWCGLSSSPVVVLLTNTQWWLTRARWWWLMLLRLVKPLHASHGESNSFAQKVFTFGAKNQDIDGVLQLRQLGTTSQRCSKWELQGKYYLRRLLLWLKKCFHHIANTVWKDHWQTLWNGWFTNKMC